MLDYLLLENKKNLQVTWDDGTSEKYIDLLTPTSYAIESSFGEVIIVNEHYVARPDLISLAMYGEDRFADLICKYNGISNPFEMNENDVLIIPQVFELENMIQHGKVSELINKKEKRRNISNDGKIEYQKYKDEKRTPAEALVGEKNFIIDKSLGLVFY